MEIYLSVENENKYYMGSITYKDIFDELIINGFNVKNGIEIENVTLKDLEFKGREVTDCKLGEDDKFEVFIKVYFK